MIRECTCDNLAYPCDIHDTESPDVVRPGNSIQKWSDEAMFTAEPSDATNGPRVYLLAAPADPLGAVAAAAKMYKGEVVRDLATVTDADRRYYLGEMKKTKLKMPLEAVQLHFLLDGVTRAFTHQLVRQRTAAYAQESMRFAVIEDSFVNRVALPPSLAGTRSWSERVSQTMDDLPNSTYDQAADATDRASTKQERWRRRWDEVLDVIQENYKILVDAGMPAEDARGLLPTNITTRVHYITNLRSLLDHAGNRLCTQAQFEWRQVFAQISQVLRNYEPVYSRTWTSGPNNECVSLQHGCRGNWQYFELSQLLQPACYQVGKCVFGAEFDRKCSIRNRVQMYASAGVSSDRWGDGCQVTKEFSIAPIFPAEWLLDPGAAR